MPKYRLLDAEELKSLEKEFIDYLIVNGITADDWAKMKEDEKDKAEQILDLFSDVVMEGALRKIEFIELRAKSVLRVFHCQKEQMVEVGMTAKGDEVDFTSQAFIQSATQSPPEGLKVYTRTEDYEDATRETVIFNLLQSGWTIASKQLFITLSLSLPR